MKHCKNYRTFDNMQITDVTIPPNQVSQTELYVMRLILQLRGKVLDIGYGFDGSMIIETLFNDDVTRKKFCKMTEKVIDSGQPIPVTSITGKNRKEMAELKINLRSMFAEFQAIMDKILPVIQFIYANGGWYDKKTNHFLGLDAIEIAHNASKLPKDVEKAIEAFGTFMNAYMMGRTLTDNSSIVSHDNSAENTEQ